MRSENFFKIILSDIRKRKNLELYLILTAAISILVADISGIETGNTIIEIVLAALSVIIYGMITDRHYNYMTEKKLNNIESSLNALTNSTRTLFLEDFPPNIKDEIKTSSEIWLFGVSLNKTIKQYYVDIEHKLRVGHTIRVLLVNPEGVAAEIAGNRDYWEPDIEGTRRRIRDTLKLLNTLRLIAPDNLEIRTINDPLGYGATLIDPNSISGTIYIEHYPFRSIGKSIPKTVLKTNDGYWYDIFKREVNTLWENGVEWKSD